MAESPIRVLMATRAELAHLTSGLHSPVEVVVERTEDLGRATATARMTRPEVVVVDAGLEERRLLRLCDRLARHTPEVRIVLAAGVDDEALYRAVLHGGHSVARTSAGPEALALTVRAAVRGEASVTPGVAARLVLDMEAYSARHADPIDPPPTLTATEADVLERLAERWSVEDLAERRGLRPALIARHVGFAVGKLHRCYRADPRLFDEELAQAHGDGPV